MEDIMKKKFPAYFKNFIIPEWAREQRLDVFSACPTGKVDRLSFLNSFEENGFKLLDEERKDDPSQYSLSVCTKYRDIKRFMTMTSKYKKPFVIAKGFTNPSYGICLETKEWKKNIGEKYKGSHVDWWLYEDAEPFKDFEVYNNEY